MTSTAPGQAVTAVNLGEQGPSSILEAVFHPDLTTAQQQGSKLATSWSHMRLDFELCA